MSNELIVLDEASEFTKEQMDYLIARNKRTKILGNCNRCGKCCEQAYRFVWVGALLPDSSDYDMKKAEHKPYSDTALPCEKLVYDIATRTAICLIQDNKPLLCKYFPYLPEDIIFEQCGFKIKE